MIAPNERLLRALVNLEGNHDFSTVLDWISESYKERLAENTDLVDEIRLRWGQGRAQELNEVLQTVKGARNWLK